VFVREIVRVVYGWVKVCVCARTSTGVTQEIRREGGESEENPAEPLVPPHNFTDNEKHSPITNAQ